MSKKKQKLKKIDRKRAVIYCRVSSDRQVKEGNGLDSQESRCVNRANQLGLQVAKVFKEEGITGGLFERPSMVKLIEFLDDHPKEKFVVIFDDLKRFARNVEVHIRLKKELVEKREARLECLNFKFDDTPIGKAVEIILAATGQLEKDQNTEQVINKMKARLEAGYWPFCPPPGLKNINKLLTPYEPYASIYKAAIEYYRDFKLNTLEEVQQFILVAYSRNGIKRPISLHGVTNILTQPLYAGYVKYEPWGVPMRKGMHEGFITYETYKLVQQKLEKSKKPRLRKDYSDDFPLRGYVVCRFCGKPLTSAWFKGKKKKYAYYICKTQGCEYRQKSIPAPVMEKRFESLLKSVTPQPEVMQLTEVIVCRMWNGRMLNEKKAKVTLQNQILKLEQCNDLLIMRIPSASTEVMVKQYEKAIDESVKQIEDLKLELAKTKYSQDGYQTALRVVFSFVENPLQQWRKPDYHNKRLLLNMYFRNKIPYHIDLGFQTPDIPLILKLISQKDVSKDSLVDTGENTSNPVIDYLTRFWKYYQATPALQNILINR